MSKILLGLFTVAALLTAAYIVLLRRPLPDPQGASGFKKRFLVAVCAACALFVMAGWHSPALGQECPPGVQCQEESSGEARSEDGEFIKGLKAVWTAMDDKDGSAFQREASRAAKKGLIRHKVARMLTTVFKELAYHRSRTSPGQRRTCYRMSLMGGELKNSRSALMKQLELLRKARASGALDPQTTAKVHKVIAREVETLYRAGRMEKGDRSAEARFLLERDKGLEGGDAAAVSGALIVHLEGGEMNLAPAQRLQAMKDRVQRLLLQGPGSNDWAHRGVIPNMIKVFRDYGLLPPPQPGPTCYSPTPGRTMTAGERSADLRMLQRMILDKNVKAGVLPLEVADKIRKASEGTGGLDEAREKDIARYQKKVRRAVRLLCRQGEVTSAFVQSMEDAIDMDIVTFQPDKALRHDVAFHLRGAISVEWREAVLAMLEKQGHLPTPRNHRFKIMWVMGRPPAPALVKKQLDFLDNLLAAREHFELEGDAGKTLWKGRLPRTHLDLRLRLRYLLRCLILADMTSPEKLVTAEQALGIPVIGKIQ